jgi:hypothetical protein
MNQLHAGDWVEVRSVEEILATLDGEGCLDALPFMPEMVQYCGKTFRVVKSAHKTCNTLGGGGIRRMRDAVHLEGVRCDGDAHGGCQAGCLLFWKAAWLKPVSGLEAKQRSAQTASPRAVRVRLRCTLEALTRATRVPAAEEPDAEERYRCQATELGRATVPARWWDPRLYLQDVASRNVRLWELAGYGLIAAFNSLMRMARGRLPTYPYIRGLAGDTTPGASLNLQPGEWVQVRSKAEIMGTLNGNFRNRGLSFDVEMVPFCGKTFRVLRRVERLVDDRTGHLRVPRNPCLVLDGVICGGCLSTGRLFCPRGIYPYWHEIWLKRVERNDESQDPENR